jgi:hypothetical protein
LLATNFGCVWLLTRTAGTYCRRITKSEYLTEYDEIVKTIQMYISGNKQGKGELMRPAFHPDALFFGYAGEQRAMGTQFLFDWIDKNGPAPKIEPRVISVDNYRVHRCRSSGGRRLVGKFGWLRRPYVRPVYASENAKRWKIIQKAFHWHA